MLFWPGISCTSCVFVCVFNDGTQKSYNTTNRIQVFDPFSSCSRFSFHLQTKDYRWLPAKHIETATIEELGTEYKQTERRKRSECRTGTDWMIDWLTEWPTGWLAARRALFSVATLHQRTTAFLLLPFRVCLTGFPSHSLVLRIPRIDKRSLRQAFPAFPHDDTCKLRIPERIASLPAAYLSDK